MCSNVHEESSSTMKQDFITKLPGDSTVAGSLTVRKDVAGDSTVLFAENRQAAVSSNLSVITSLQFNLGDSSNAAAYGGIIHVGKDADYMSAGNSQSYMSFVVRNNTAVEAMRVNHLGYLGVGQTNPNYPLDILQTAVDCTARIQTNKVNGLAQLLFTNDARTWILKTASNDNFVIRDNTGTVDVITCEVGGKVGINQGTPAEYLDVNGNIIANTIYTRNNGNFAAGGTGNAGITFHNASIPASANQEWMLANNATGDYLTVYRYNAGTFQGVDMFFDGTGNIGMGVTVGALSDRLAVGGMISATGTYGVTRLCHEGTDEHRIHVRPNAGKNGALAFTENSVGDRWAIGIRPADTTLYFCSGSTSVTATPKFYMATTGFGIGISPTEKLHVDGAALIGDSVTSFSNTGAGVINKYIGTNANAEKSYLLLCRTLTAAGTFPTTGFDGVISYYRGNATNGLISCDIEISAKNAYNTYSSSKFMTRGITANLVTLTYGGLGYLAIETSAMVSTNIFITGRYWTSLPQVVDLTSVSAVTLYRAPYFTQAITGAVGFGVSMPKTTVDLGTGPFGGTAGLTNASSRPALSAGRSSGELFGYSSPDITNDDGFLRISAGGGTNANTRTYIDLSGFSAVTDMDRNLIMGTAGTERLRITSGGAVAIPSATGMYYIGNPDAAAQDDIRFRKSGSTLLIEMCSVAGSPGTWVSVGTFSR